MYHRIARMTVDPWHLAVDPGHFDSQVRLLRQYADIVPLVELHGCLRSGRRSRPVVAITFDDAYLDNLEVAKPILERYAAPATVFVPTGYVGSGLPFWWDRLAHFILGPARLPASLEVQAGGDVFRWSDAGAAAEGSAGSRARRRLHDALWRWLHGKAGETRDAALGVVAAWAGVDACAPQGARPMTRAELQTLCAGGLIEIGAHSVTHPQLTHWPSERKSSEIRGSRAACAEMLGRTPRAFAFPNGDYDDECLALVRAAGFEVACTSRAELVWASADRHCTPRISVANESGEALRRRLRFEWLA